MKIKKTKQINIITKDNIVQLQIISQFSPGPVYPFTTAETHFNFQYFYAINTVYCRDREIVCLEQLLSLTMLMANDKF